MVTVVRKLVLRLVWSRVESCRILVREGKHSMYLCLTWFRLKCLHVKDSHSSRVSPSQYINFMQHSVLLSRLAKRDTKTTKPLGRWEIGVLTIDTSDYKG